MRKAVFAYSKNKGADKLCGDQLISTFIFNLNTVQFLFLLNLNFQAYVFVQSCLCLNMPLTKYTGYLVTCLKSDPHRTSTPYYFSADLAISIFYGWWLIIWTFIHTHSNN